jgi:hypothetical protein
MLSTPGENSSFAGRKIPTPKLPANVESRISALPERGLVHPQQRSQFLIQRRLRPHPPTVAQCDREPPHLALFATGIEIAQMSWAGTRNL